MELRPVPLVSERKGLLSRILERHSRSSHSPLAPNRGLYVSTGGFTKETRYEADRAYVPIRLLDLDSFVRNYVEIYDKVSDNDRAILPLTRVWLPA